MKSDKVQGKTKSKAVKILLKHSTCICNEEQALQTIEILEKYVGMLPPLAWLEAMKTHDNAWLPEKK